jgi:TolB-like protein/DNA-binding SARP family transcriptional activator
MAILMLRLLGEFRVSSPEKPTIRLPTRKSEALLIFLASPCGVARLREQLAGLLWSRSAEEQARMSLRQSLTRLRKSLGSAKEVIAANAQQIELVAEHVETDVAKFEGLVSRSDIVSLEAAAELLNGGFARGFHVNEGPFEEWITTERRRITELAITALGSLPDQYEKLGEWGKAAMISCKLLAIDPLQERMHRSLMRALANQDRFEPALQQYKLCRDILRKARGIEPCGETNSLRDEIASRRQSSLQAPHAPAVETSELVRALGNKPAKKPALGADVPAQLQSLDLTIPERPSIVILPFENLTGRTDNDHMAEGIRIDIQAALVKITGIFLIAAGSANAMRGRDARSVGEALGVRYVLLGSVRRSGPNLRISAELIDAHAGSAIWTETYDRLFDDGFAVQDEIIEKIITALDVKLLRGEQAAVWRKTLKNRDALESFYRGVEQFFKLQKEPVLRARRFFEIVDKKQPEISIGATWVALCHWFDAFKAWGEDPAASLALAEEWAEKAVTMEDGDGQAHMVLGHVHLMNRRFDDALIIGREAVALRPNCTNADGFFANILHFCGEQDDAIEHITWSIRYSPVYPPFFADVLALALLFRDHFKAAEAVASESLRVNPGGATAQLVRAASFSAREMSGAAREAAERVIASDPGFSVQRFAEQQPYRRPSDLEAFASRLIAAGLPA